MKAKSYLIFAVFACVIAPWLPFSLPVSACTGITIKPQDGAIIRARTLEFGTELNSNLVIIPRSTKFNGADGDAVGLKWTGKYGLVGTNILGRPIIADGLNEKGLSAGLFYHPTSATYQTVTPDDAGKVLAPWDMATYVLSTCASVDEAVEALKHAIVGAVVFKDWGMVPQVHFILADPTGRCVVIEFTDGVMKVFENPLGVITNSPTFDWHMTNLRNYIGLSAFTPPTVQAGEITLVPLGQGGGMRGLPGDFTSPSRFVRAVTFSQTALPVATAEEGVLQAFHLLNQFDIPKGSSREKNGDNVVAEYTEWTSAADMTNRLFFVRTFADSRIRVVDLKRCSLDATDILTIKLDSKESFLDLTPSAK